MADDKPKTWQVIGQIEDFRQGPSGAFAHGVVVTFQLVGTTTQGSVFVPWSDYEAGRVEQYVSERAAAMAAVQALNG